MPELEHFCTIEADMKPRMIGTTPSGTRIDFPFEGEATGPHWEGSRPVRGTDHLTVRSDGNMDLEIHGTIGAKRDTVAYRATGVSIGVSPTEAHPQELLTFATGNEDLGWLNSCIGVALGKGVEGKLTLDVYIVRP